MSRTEFFTTLRSLLVTAREYAWALREFHMGRGATALDKLRQLAAKRDGSA